MTFPHAGSTGGTYGAGVSLESRGIGDATVFVWFREGSYSGRPELTLLNPQESGVATMCESEVWM
jgi:hypothetical protein